MKTLTYNLIVLILVLVLFEIFFRLIFFGPQDLLLPGSDTSPHVQLPERLIPRDEKRERLSTVELYRLPYSARLNRLYKISSYRIYGDLEPNRDSLVLHNTDHPYRVVTNSSGVRRKSEIGEKDPGTIRVLCLGDSFTFGPFLSNTDTYPYLAEAILNGRGAGNQYEVINAGRAGYFLKREKNLYTSRARRMNPDVVVLQVLDNDVTDYREDGFNRPPSEEYVRETASRLKTQVVSYVKANSDRVALFYFVTWLLAKSYDASHLERDKRVVKEPSVANPLSVDEARDPSVSNIWRSAEFEGLLRELQEENENDFEALVSEVETNGSELLVLYIPTQQTLRWRHDGGDPIEKYYEDLTEKYGVRFLSVTNEFEEVNNVETLYLWPWNGHLSVHGTYRVARSLAEELVKIVQ